MHHIESRRDPNPLMPGFRRRAAVTGHASGTLHDVDYRFFRIDFQEVSTTRFSQGVL